MLNTCLIVADGTRARLFLVESDEGPRRKLRLTERATLVNQEPRMSGESAGRVKSEHNTSRQAGPMHPIGVERERHRLEHEQRFGAEVVERALEVTADWEEGVIILIAEPRLLGLMRQRLRNALKGAIKLEELAKDYGGLSTVELERLVVAHGLVRQDS